MEYNEALEYIHGTYKFGIKLGLENIKSLLKLMGDPQKKLKFVHIAGTNGKGSTVAFISSILTEAGLKTGIYTSPFINRYNERIKINSKNISDCELAYLTATVKEKVDEMLADGGSHPTEFEIGTAIALKYFADNNCDIVVLEVGMGGRFDSTNIIEEALVSVITTISFDHMQWLGSTLPEIAFEKAGIIKEKGTVVLYPQRREVEEVFEAVCTEKEAHLVKVDFSKLCTLKFDIQGRTFNFENHKELKIKLLGEHQAKNAVVALKAVEILHNKGYNITEDAIKKGLLKAVWPGRFEVVNEKPVVIIDGAHNREGAKVLADTLKNYFPNKKITFIIGVLKDKEYIQIIEAVIPAAKRFVTVTPNNKRALASKELANIISTYCKNVQDSDTIVNAIDKCLGEAGPDDIICVFGSLYYIGEVRKYFGLE